MVRAHEVHMDGYKLYNWNGEKEVPCVVSIFGAPNYCDVYKNQSACLYYKGEKR
jgi:serine/threonine-protein phosphatase 2B catalytic subunit